MEQWKQIEPDEFWQLLQQGDLQPEQIVDVRESHEWDYYHLAGSKLMPMSELQETWQEIPSSLPVYIICAHGVRSQAVCRYLNEKGYGSIANVIGGMAAVSSFDGFQYD